MIEQIIVCNPETYDDEAWTVYADDLDTAASMLRGAQDLLHENNWIRDWYYGRRVSEFERVVGDGSLHCETAGGETFEYLAQLEGPTIETDCYSLSGAVQEMIEPKSVEDAEHWYYHKLIHEVWGIVHREPMSYMNDRAESVYEVMLWVDKVIDKLEAMAREKRAAQA